MKTKLESEIIVGIIASIVVLGLAVQTIAQTVPGVPEPGLVMYGQVRNTARGTNLLTYGNLRWTIQPASGSPATITTALTNINDQFSYVIRVPFETVLSGMYLSSGSLSMPSGPASFSRRGWVNNYPASILSAGGSNFTFSAADRGRIERVDIQVAIGITDSDSNGMDDNWERTYFGHIGVDPTDDADRDGLNNLREFKAGTHPLDSTSCFEFLEAKSITGGVYMIRWSSVALQKYSILRSTDLLSGFTPLVGGIEATPTTNTYMDSTATNLSTTFYQLRVE